MAYTLPLSLYSVPDTMQSSNLLDFVQDYDPGYVGALSAVPVDASAKAGDGVYTTYPVDLPGEFVSTFFNDWYNRIHFVPSLLEMGNLLSNQTRDIVVWNAYFVSKPIEGFAIAGGDGINVIPPGEPPFNAAPLGRYTYVVEVSTQGPPTIGSTFTWLVDGIEYRVNVTGRRVTTWSFKPNWANPVDETLEWMTAIEASQDRTEQRTEQRDAPRRVIEYSAQIKNNDTSLFESAMFGWADRMFALPLWMEPSNLTTAIEVGDTALAIATADRSYEANGLVMLYASASAYEAVEIESVADGLVTLKKGVEANWPVGTRVFPVMVARLDGAANARYIGEDKLEVPVRFVGSPAETPTRLPAVAPALLYKGVEVYTQGTNWIAGMDVSFQPDYDLHDNQFGVFSPRPRAGWPTIVKAHEWLSKTRVEATTLRAFFARRKGRLVPVWMPTGTADFKLLADVVQTDIALTVADNDYALLIAGHPARKHVIIQLRGGTNIIREIDTVAPQGDGTAQLRLMSAVGTNFTVKQVRRISYLGLYRLAGDAVTISHKTTAASVTQTSMQLTRPAP